GRGDLAPAVRGHARRRGVRAARRRARGSGRPRSHPRKPPPGHARLLLLMKQRLVRFFGHGGGVAFYLVGVMLLVTAGSTALFAGTPYRHVHRELARMGCEERLDRP